MKMKLLLAALTVLTAALGAAGCSEPAGNNTYSDQLVVNAYLVGNEPIDSIFVQRTGRVTELYTDESAAVTNAVVVITGNNFVDTLVQDPGMHGMYASRHKERLVRPGASYSLSVRVPGYDDVSGTTSVPDTFSVTNSGAFPRTTRYTPAAAPFSVAWNDSRLFEDYLVVVRSLDLTQGQIPKSFTNDQVPDRTQIGFFLKDAHASEISWLYFNYYGKTEITVVAVDKNYFDYMKQAMAGQGASDIREIRYNLTGALGVFGAETVANNRIEMTVTP